MLQNAYFLAKIGADTAENEQHFAEILPKTGNYPTGPSRKRGEVARMSVFEIVAQFERSTRLKLIVRPMIHRSHIEPETRCFAFGGIIIVFCLQQLRNRREGR